MGFDVFIFVVLMLVTFLIANLGGKSNKRLDTRKQQSKNILRENVLKKQLESYTENKVKFSKRYAIETMSLQAGFKLSYAEYMILSVATALVVAIVIGAVSNNFLLGILFFFVGYILPKQLLMFLKNSRIGKMEQQIGPFMQMVIMRYKATKDFANALELTTAEFKGEEPLYSELKQTVLEMNVGVPVSDAMDSLARRTGNKYMGRLSDYYKIASSLGTEDIRERLLNQAYAQFEEDRRAKLSMKKELSEPKREAYIMLATIPMFAVYQVFTNPDYVHFMTHTTMGQIGTAIISAIFMGVLWFVNAKVGAPLE